MNIGESSSPKEIFRESLDCSEIVVRAITSRKWIIEESKSIDPAAFMRRLTNGQREDAISVSRLSVSTIAESLSGFNKQYGAASLHTGQVRSDLPGFDVVGDPVPAHDGKPSRPGHALIMDITDKIADLAHAEWAATQLSLRARLVR